MDVSDDERAPLALEGDEAENVFPLLEPDDDPQELGNDLTSQHRSKQKWCMCCTLLAAAIACCVVVYLGIGAFWREASVEYTVDEDGWFTRTVRYPRGYGVVYYKVEPGDMCSAASNKPCPDFKLGAQKGYSFRYFKTKQVSRSSRDWFTPGERDVELGVNFRIPLETHVQVGNAHKNLSKNRTISERCGYYLVITKFYESVYQHLDEMIESWSGTEIAPVYGTYDAATDTYNPRIAIPDLYGVVRYNEKKSDDLWVANARLPAGYGLVLLKVEPELGGDGLRFSCDLGGSFGLGQGKARNVRWGGSRRVYFPEYGDVETVLLPPEHYVKIASSPSRTRGTPAQLERSGSYAVLTKNPDELYQTVCDLVFKNWWTPHGTVEFTDLTHWQVTVPNKYGAVRYEVWPAWGSDEPRPAWEKDSPCNISLESSWPYDSSFSGSSNFPLYHPEMGDKAFRTLGLGEHVKVSSTSDMYPFQPKNETLARQCGTYVVMTDDPRGLVKSLDNAMICKMLE